MNGRWLAAAALVAVALLALAALYTATHRPGSTGGEGGGAAAGEGGGGGLLVVTSFPNLASDVRLLLCPDDRVESLAPPGVDPHDYQLTPEDLEKIRGADLVVSTGHAPFEAKLHGVVPGDRLVEIPRVPGIRLADNPVTGKPVYHMPIYDPGNYRVFMRYLEERLERLRPECREAYRRNLENVLGRLDGIVSGAPRLDRSAVASGPVAVYAVEWTGLRVEWLLAPEHGVPPSQEGLQRARELLDKGAVAVIVVNGRGEPWGRVDEKLASMARDAGAPVLRVPAPFIPGSVLDKLEYIAEQLGEVREG